MIKYIQGGRFYSISGTFGVVSRSFGAMGRLDVGKFWLQGPNGIDYKLITFEPNKKKQTNINAERVMNLLKWVAHKRAFNRIIPDPLAVWVAPTRVARIAKAPFYSRPPGSEGGTDKSNQNSRGPILASVAPVMAVKINWCVYICSNQTGLFQCLGYSGDS